MTDLARSHQAIADLLAALDAIEPRIRLFRVSPEHWTAHLSLLGYMSDFVGSARAVLVLATHPETRLALWSSARLAFEAAQDALLLVTSEDVDEAGAEIRAFERLEQADWKGKVAIAFPDDAGDESYADVVAAEIEHILADTENGIRVAPELVAKMRAAIERRRPKYARPDAHKPSHWYDSRKKIARDIAERIHVPEEARRQTMLYAHLSRFAHPRFRADAHEKLKGPPTLETFTPTEPAIRQAIEFTEIAANIMAMALNVVQGRSAAEGIPLVPGAQPEVPSLG